MSVRAPFSARVVLSAFRAVARLLPREFRDVWFAEAAGDLERTLGDIHRRSGARATLAAGTRALIDLALAVVRERWSDRQERSSRPDASRRLTGRKGEMDVVAGVVTGLRLALRSLRRRPAYAGSAIVVCETCERGTMSARIAHAITTCPGASGCTASLIMVHLGFFVRCWSVIELSGPYMSTKPNPRTSACSRSQAP